MYRLFAIVSVSIYLFCILIFLLFKRKVAPLYPLKRLLKFYLTTPYRGPITAFKADEGFCWTVELPHHFVSDEIGISPLRVLEDGKTLLQAHANHDDIRKQGLGRFSHWGTKLYFSTSDNTSPLENGRTYEIAEAR